VATEEKTEPASPRRRQEARKKGQVAKSQEVASAFILLFSFSMFALYGRYMYAYMQAYMRWVLSPTIFVNLKPLNDANVAYIIGNMTLVIVRILAPFLLVIAAVGLAVNFLQVGLFVSTEPIKPNFKKLNPITGFSRLFSMRSLTELIKSIAKVSLVGYVGYTHIRAAIPSFSQMLEMGVEQGFVFFCISTLWLAIKIALLLMILALFDYAYQKYDFEKSIRMTKQELKDEYKQREGDPLVRRRIRERQREIAMRRMMASVPKADVVITNPIELALALQYVAGEMHAPKIVAKGGGVVAERIKQIAKENKVPIVEDRPLAQALFRLCDVDDYVPTQLFKAVAEILAYVYRVSRKDHSFGI
jgi:flagellar biosynthesis protein FlhB